MDEHHSSYNGSVWHIHWPYQLYIGQWPICYGPVILLHILKTILMEKRCTWDNGSLWLKDGPYKIYVGQWPIFHGPLMLPYVIVSLKLFLYIKKWHRPGVFVPLWVLALVQAFFWHVLKHWVPAQPNLSMLSILTIRGMIKKFSAQPR